MRRNWLLALSLALCSIPVARAEVKTKTVTYEFDGVTLKGHLAWDDAVKGKRPKVAERHHSLAGHVKHHGRLVRPGSDSLLVRLGKVAVPT